MLTNKSIGVTRDTAAVLLVCKFSLNTDCNANGRCLLKCSRHVCPFCLLFRHAKLPIFRSYFSLLYWSYHIKFQNIIYYNL